MMSFGPGKVRSIRTCHGSTISGRPVVEMALNFGAASRHEASEARFASSASGRPADDGPKRPMLENLQRIPSARTIARLMTIGRDMLTKAETVTVAAIEAGVPTLVEAREIIAEFHLMIRRKAEAGLHPGSSAPAPVSLPRSLAASRRMKPRFGRQSLRPGPTDRLRVRSRASSSSDGKCTAAGKSICFRLRLIGAE